MLPAGYSSGQDITRSESFNRLLRQILLLPILALALLSGVLYFLISAAKSTVDLIQFSDQRIAEMNLIQRLIVDEETGVRGYEVTGDPIFLEPYRRAGTALQAIFDSRIKAPVGDPLQRKALLELRTQEQNWRASFADPYIQSVSSRRHAVDQTIDLAGKRQMDAMRAQIAGILDRAQMRRATRIALWHKQMTSIIAALFALAVGGGVSIGSFARSKVHALSEAYSSSLQSTTQKMEELFRSEEHLRTTLTSIGDGVITCDPEGKVQILNSVAEELTGWKAAEAIGKDLTEVLHIVNEETRMPVEDPVSKVRRLDRIVGLANHTVLIRKDMSELHIADSAAPVRAKDGHTYGIVMVFRDVTPERKMQDALLANEKLAVAGRLAATIAHEVHNPLDLVANLLYLLQTSASHAESAKFIEMAQNEVARVIDISRAMLGLYRESAVAVEVDLHNVLRELLLLMEMTFADLSISITSELTPGIRVQGFPGELRQVFTNLITNAAEAAGRSGKVMVCLNAEHKPDAAGHLKKWAAVSVSDNGPGISEVVMLKLFQPFFTTKGANGTGLGLWVSRGIVTKHGGTLELTSDMKGFSQGTEARVLLPAI